MDVFLAVLSIAATFSATDGFITPNTTVAVKPSSTLKFTDVPSADEEVYVKAGEDEAISCPNYANLAVTFAWKKGDGVITEDTDIRYSFDGLYKNLLKITNIKYSDRSIFTCIATLGNQTTTHEYTLRVRDPLGALWPVLGIVVQTIILIIIISTYEFFKKRNGKNQSIDTSDSADVQENGQ